MLSLENSYRMEFITCSVPAVKICIGSEIQWSSKGEMTIDSIVISMGVGNESSNCIIKLSKPFKNFEKGIFLPGNEFDVIKHGEKIKVFLGYSDAILVKCNLAFKGFVSKAKIEYTREVVNITIECMDGKMWMMPGREFKKMLGNKYSSIVRSVLEPSYTKYIKGNKISIIGEPTLTNSVYQSNESDYEFLCRLADTTNSFFYIYLGKAYFISPGALKFISLSIAPCDLVESVSWGFDVLGLSQSVSVEGTNFKNPKLEVQSAPVMANIQSVGQGIPPAVLSPNIGATTKESITDNTVNSISEAQFVAQSRFTKNSIKFVTCVVKISGYTSMSDATFFLGMGVNLIGFSKPIDNTYILTKIEHKYDGKNFTTILTLSTDSCLEALKTI